MSNSGRLILSLCDLSGVWPAPYLAAGYTVRRVDIQGGEDVRLMEFPREPVHGILAAPPCTMFAAAGNRWVRTPQQMIEALSVVDACLRLVAVCRPVWWCLENPRGKLRRYLGPPRHIFDPCDYGDPWTKKTLLWGSFVPPIPGSVVTSTRPVTPTEGSRVHRLPGVRPSDSVEVARRKRAARSETPAGFARAFFEFNP